MAKQEIDSDLCSFWHSTEVPVTANVYRQDSLTKLLVGKLGNLACCKFHFFGGGCKSNHVTYLDILHINMV